MYPSWKSWDEVSVRASSGKELYYNIITGSAVKMEYFYVVTIMPVRYGLLAILQLLWVSLLGEEEVRRMDLMMMVIHSSLIAS